MYNPYNTYGYPYYQPNQQVQPQQQIHQEILGVDGIEGMNKVVLAPNSSIFAYDRSASGAYGFIKATDAVGIATTKRVKLVFLDDNETEPKQVVEEKYVLKTDFDDLAEKVTSMWEELNGKSN